MKKLIHIITIGIVAATMLLSASLTFAAPDCSKICTPDDCTFAARLQRVACSAGYISPTQTTDAVNTTTIVTLIGGILNVIISLTGVIFAAITIYGGFLWMTARGNSQQVEESQQLIRNSIIGILLTFSAFVISFFVLYSLKQIGL